jgi:hypothetical protein
MDSRFPEELIQPNDWRQKVFPGSEIFMSVYLARLYDAAAQCPRPGCLEVVTEDLDPRLDTNMLQWLARLIWSSKPSC